MQRERTGPFWAIAIVAVALGAAACSSTPGQSTTSPSALPAVAGAASDSVKTPAAATVRKYKGAITPDTSTVAVTQNYAVTITNCTGTTCDSNNVTSQNQEIGHATVTIPAGFTGVGNLHVTTSNTDDQTWTGSLSAGVITLVAPAGNKRLGGGDSVTVTFDATAPCAADKYYFPTAAYQDVDPNLNGTVYGRFGDVPSVTVSGSCQPSVCTFGQGYWKTHGPVPTGNNSNVWPVSSLLLGSVPYTSLQLQSIFDTPVAGNGLINLGHQLIAAKLNVANGASPTAISASIASADGMIGALVVPPVGGGSLAPGDVSALVTILTNYNDGVIGPGACAGQ